MVEAIQCTRRQKVDKYSGYCGAIILSSHTIGHLERVFSHVKLIKGERHASLSVEAPHPSNWDTSGAVELWWHDKTRRVNTTDTRATPRLASTSSAASSSDDCTNSFFSLENWESWLEKSD